MKRNTWLVPAIVTTALLTACGGDDNNNADKTEPNARYEFDSQFVDGESAVSYTGQTARQVLIAELTDTISGLERNSESPKDLLESYVYQKLNDKNYKFSKVSNATPGPKYGDISKNKNLVDKIAGGYIEINESGEETRKGETATLQGNFIGWEGVNYPIELVDLFIEKIVALTVPAPESSISGNEIIKERYINEGRDYEQLTQKFLLGAVAFSQGTAKYLKTNFRENNKQDGEKPYTTAEHKWDEAFGYFGAARDYSDYTDKEIASKDSFFRDTSGPDGKPDGQIDLRSEINLANSTNCAKRDLGTKDSANPTDYTKEAFEAFVAGRKILNDAAKDTSRNLSDEEVKGLEKHAIKAAEVWENCIAATVVHYINETQADLSDDSGNPITLFEDEEAYKKLAKHWSEMKGFALGLQFNPESPFQAAREKFKKLHELMGTKPALPNEEGLDDYLKDLDEAKKIMQEIYAFDPEHVKNW